MSLFFKETNYAILKSIFFILNTKETNYGIFSNKPGENFNLAEMFLIDRVRL